MAAVYRRDDNRDHFPLDPAEVGPTAHHVSVKLVVSGCVINMMLSTTPAGSKYCDTDLSGNQRLLTLL